VSKIRQVESEKPKKCQLSIPDLFDGTMLKTLAKRPDEHYQKAADLLVDLERVAKFQGVAAGFRRRRAIVARRPGSSGQISRPATAVWARRRVRGRKLH
jgi:hypothetical protein